MNIMQSYVMRVKSNIFIIDVKDIIATHLSNSLCMIQIKSVENKRTNYKTLNTCPEPLPCDSVAPRSYASGFKPLGSVVMGGLFLLPCGFAGPKGMDD